MPLGGVVCLEKMTPAVWGMAQHRDPGSWILVAVPLVLSAEPQNIFVFRHIVMLIFLAKVANDIVLSISCKETHFLCVFEVVLPLSCHFI